MRLAHPTIYGLFYNKDDPINPWVKKGWTRWTIQDWEAKFGPEVTQRNDLRTWDFFGYSIPLYDDKKT